MQRNGILAGIVCGAFLLAGPGVARAGVDMQEGEWETTVVSTMETEGMTMPPMTSTMTSCLTKKDLVPNPNPDQANNCRVLDQKVSGNTVSWRLVCDQDGGKMEGSGEMTYHGASYEGTMRASTVAEGQTMKTVMKLSGRHLGVCTARTAKGPVVNGKDMGQYQQEMGKYQAMADQAMARQKQEMAKYQAGVKAGSDLIKLPVPAADSNACRQPGFAAMADCAAQAGDLNLQPGLFRIPLERASRTGDMEATPVDRQQEERCLTQDVPVPYSLAGSHDIREVSRSRDKITWSFADAQTAVRGGLVYQGNTMSGVINETNRLSPDMQITQVTRVTAERLGDGDCLGGGRAYTSQTPAAASSQGQGAASGINGAMQEAGKELINNPMKGLRSIIGF